MREIRKKPVEIAQTVLELEAATLPSRKIKQKYQNTDER